MNPNAEVERRAGFQTGATPVLVTNPAPDDPFLWSARRLGWVMVVLVAALFLLAHLFSANAPQPVRVADARPAMRLAPHWPDEYFAPASPVLFAAPHPLGFSGRAWLAAPKLDYRPVQADDGPAWLAPDPGSLAMAFGDFVRTNPPARVAAAMRPSPEPLLPSVALLSALLAPSRVVVDAELAPLAWQPPVELPAWTNGETLLPTEVRVLVDGAGQPVSAVLLKGSGLPEADQFALDIARRAVFEAGPAAGGEPVASLRSGRLQFHWLTLPPANGADGGAL